MTKLLKKAMAHKRGAVLKLLEHILLLELLSSSRIKSERFLLSVPLSGCTVFSPNRNVFHSTKNLGTFKMEPNGAGTEIT